LRRNRPFLLLWTGAGTSLLGTRMSTVCYSLLVLWYTRSAVDAGLVAFCAQLPQLVVQLPAGALVDRWPRRRLMIWCDVVGLLAMGSLAAALALGRLWLPHLMAVAFVESSVTLFYRLAEKAAVRHVVPQEQLPAALAQNEARGQVATLLGQPVGSLLFTCARWLPFLVTAVGHLFAFSTLSLIRQDFEGVRAQGPPRRLHRDIAEGLAWVARQRFLRFAAAIVAVSNFVFQVLGLVLVVAVHAGGHSAASIGVIVAIAGLGGTAGALGGGWWMRHLSARWLVVSAAAAWAGTIPLVAATRDPLLFGVLFAVMSYVGGVLNVAAGVYQVRITPDELQGRAGSVTTLISSGTNAIGAVSGGFLVAAFGVNHTVLGLAALMGLLALAAIVAPALRDVPTEAAEPAADEPAAAAE
jgi:predicted MFS family arabinose efflux permease